MTHTRLEDRHTEKTVQNLTLVFSFDGIGVPVAISGLLHPVWAMAAMIASVTTILTNSFAGRLIPKARGRPQKQITFHVENMHCEHCLDSISKALKHVQVVEDVIGDPASQLVTVHYREGFVEPDGIREVIVEQGFQVAA